MRYECLLLLMILITLPNLPTILAQEGSGLFTYVYTVKDTGWIDILTTFESNSSGSTWILVPKFRDYNFTVLSGSIKEKKLIRDTTYYFYSNLTFSYEPGTKVTISWSYRFGALIVEPNGAFFSTQIAFSPYDDAIVMVKLPIQFIPNGIEPSGFEMEREDEFNVVKYELDGARNNTMRVLISFKVKDGQEFKEEEVGKLKISYPSRYQDVVDNITKYYTAMLPLVKKYTAVNEEIPVKVRLFVPGTMEEITTLGYTGPRYTSDIITQGEINLNLMLVRMPDYELPTTFVHELLHQYMQVAGLSVELRWAHEGLAQYLSSIIVEKALGFTVPEEPDVEKAVMAKTGGDFSFLIKWKGGGLPGNPGLYYSASEILIKNFARKYGGPEIYEKFFSLIRRDRVVVDELNEFVKYLSEAAGEDVTEFFKSYGIDVRSMDPTMLALIDTARRYAESTSWFNPASQEALNFLNKHRTREGALLSICLTISGLILESLVIALPAGLLISLRGRKESSEERGEFVAKDEKSDEGDQNTLSDFSR